MKVLVTGGCGFLGSNVCEYYKKRGNEVVSIDNLTKYELLRTEYNVEGARQYNLNRLKELGVELITDDIRNKEKLFEVASDCDFIIHTAAQPAMTIAVEDPFLDFSTNVEGTLNVLESARKYDIPIVNCSTVHVYGNGINSTLKEERTRFSRDPPLINENQLVLQGALTPLHASKRSAEIYLQAYIDTYGLDAATFRLTGMYGPQQFGGEDHGWVANFVIRTILGMPIKVFGTNKQVRDILYVSDAVNAFESFNKIRKSGIYNIGGGAKTIISLGECLDLIKELTNKKQVIDYKPARPGDLWYFACDATKAKMELGWEPKISTREGVSKLIEWVCDNIKIFRRGAL